MTGISLKAFFSLIEGFIAIFQGMSLPEGFWSTTVTNRLDIKSTYPPKKLYVYTSISIASSQITYDRLRNYIFLSFQT